MNVPFFTVVLILTGLSFGQAHAGLLDDMGINSAASKLVKQQKYAPKAAHRAPAQFSGAEGVPPLPLPAVPLRRTEKKNPPRPPVLIAKLATNDRVDWATSPEDAKNLLRWMARKMKVNFSTINLPQDRIPDTAAKIPVLYRSGIRAFSFSPQQRQRLRRYLLSGGTLVLNAYCGHPDFARSAIREIQTLLPERSPYRLELDHPLYHAYYDINNIQYRPLALKAGARNNVPSAIGIDIETRTAVFFFRYDLSTAWDNMSSKARPIIGYTPQTAKKIGANLIAYLTAERGTAMPLSKAVAYVNANKTKAGKFMIAQARYNGLWKTRDAALSMLLNVFHEKTQTPVHFSDQAVDLDSPRLFDYPLVYLTGTMTFSLTPAQRSNLRRYLSHGGILFAEACDGRPSFDRAFRRELRQVLPEVKLERLSAKNLIFQYPHRISTVQPRPALAHRLKQSGRIPPLLYGAKLNGQLAVIYSPFDLSGGWSLSQDPYNQGITDNDALAMGVNILAYSLLQ